MPTAIGSRSKSVRTVCRNRQLHLERMLERVRCVGNAREAELAQVPAAFALTRTWPKGVSK